MPVRRESEGACGPAGELAAADEGGRLPLRLPASPLFASAAPDRGAGVSTPGRTRRYREEAAGELALAEIASRRLPFPPVGTPASGRLYPLEESSTRPDRHEPGAADESCG